MQQFYDFRIEKIKGLSSEEKTVRKKNLELWMNGWLPKEHTLRFERNTELIDLRYTPQNVQLKILEQKNTEPIGNRDKLPEYFKEHKLEVLEKHINDF